MKEKFLFIHTVLCVIRKHIIIIIMIYIIKKKHFPVKSSGYASQLTRPYIGSLLLTNIPKRTRPLEAQHHSLVLVVLLLREDSYTHIPCDNPKKIENWPIIYVLLCSICTLESKFSVMPFKLLKSIYNCVARTLDWVR